MDGPSNEKGHGSGNYWESFKCGSASSQMYCSLLADSGKQFCILCVNQWVGALVSNIKRLNCT